MAGSPAMILHTGSLTPSSAPSAWALKYHCPWYREHAVGVNASSSSFTAAARGSRTLLTLRHSAIVVNAVSALHCLRGCWTTNAPARCAELAAVACRLVWIIKAKLKHFVVLSSNTICTQIGTCTPGLPVVSRNRDDTLPRQPRKHTQTRIHKTACFQ